jgi:hypothetical protein
MKIRLISIVAACLLAVSFIGCAKTPEGIPREMLVDKDAATAIVFYRDYMASATIATLTKIREGKRDEAVQTQEYILDEIIVEVGPALPKYTLAQRKIAAAIFVKIAEHYGAFPRNTSKWYQDLLPEKKEDYAKIDDLLNDCIKKTRQMPDRELAGHKPLLPILILRDHMTDIAIQTLTTLRNGKGGDATRSMEDALDRLVLEAGPQIEMLSHDGQERAAGMFAKIKHYRDKYPRTGGKDDKVAAMVNSVTAKYKPHSMQTFFGVE